MTEVRQAHAMSLAPSIVAAMDTTTGKAGHPMKESMEDLLRRDLDAWLLAKALIENLRRRK
jgi:hypothetical protein